WTDGRDGSQRIAYLNAQVVQSGIGRKVFDPQGDGSIAAARRGARLRTLRIGHTPDARGLGGEFAIVLLGLPALRLLPPGGPHILRSSAFQRQHLDVVELREFDDLTGRRSRSR